jgi:hypothetical protein
MDTFQKYIRTYLLTVLAMLIAIGVINVWIDPLWYFQGNRFSQINPPWNERIAKTNLYLKTHQDYDCLLLGTSRSTLFDTSDLKQNRCFNYSFSGAKVEEYSNYLQYIAQKGIEPRKIYLEIEAESFNQRRLPSSYSPVLDPMPAYRVYLFSANALWLSIRTVKQDYFFYRLYDQNFRGQPAETAPDYEPQLNQQREAKTCDPARTEFYKTIRQIFPNTAMIGLIAPVSAWYLFNDSYQNGLVNCQLAGIHQVASFFDSLYDFAVPSALTTRTNNTYDGNHYYPRVYSRVAAVLESRTDSSASNFGVNVKATSLADYQALYAARLSQFLTQIGQAQLWQG